MITLNLLSCLLRDNDVQTILSLNRDYMNPITEVPIYDFIVDYFQRYGSLPITKMPGYFPILSDLPKAAGETQYWLDEFQKLKLGIVFETGITKIQDSLIKGDVDKAKEHLMSLSTDFLRDELKTFSVTREQALSQVIDLISTRRAQSGLLGVTTGYETLDRLTCGYLPGNIYVLAARLKMGKTMLLACMAEAAYRSGKKVLVISMEMGREEYFTRVLSLVSKISSHALFRGEVSTIGEQHLRSLRDAKGDDYIFQEGYLKTTIPELAHIISVEKPDIVYIDGAYLLKVPGATKMAVWERATEIVSQLKLLAGKLKVPIVCTYQFNREAAKKMTAGPENIHHSDAIAQIATVAMGVFDMPEYNDRKKIEVLANRNGPCGWLIVNWDWKGVNFTEVEGFEEAAITEDAPTIQEINRNEGEPQYDEGVETTGGT